MDYLTYGWGVVKENLVPWIIWGIVASIGMGIPILGIVVMMNAYRAIPKAVEANAAPEIGDLFNFDNASGDIVGGIIISLAMFSGLMVCGIGRLATVAIFFFGIFLVADGRYAGVDAAKASLAHGKANIAKILITLLIVQVVVVVGSVVTCGLGALVLYPVALVGFHKFYTDNRDDIIAAATEAGIQPA